jgi:hypothetical protein
MHRDLHLFSYKIQILQAQTAANKEERRTFCANTSQRIEDHPTNLNLKLRLLCKIKTKNIMKNRVPGFLLYIFFNFA